MKCKGPDTPEIRTRKAKQWNQLASQGSFQELKVLGLQKKPLMPKDGSLNVH
jgi:hypothetical protein